MLLWPSWESETYRKNIFLVFYSFRLIWISIQIQNLIWEMPNHKWIDKISFLFPEFEKGTWLVSHLQHLEELRFCPNPATISPDRNSVKERSAL